MPNEHAADAMSRVRLLAVAGRLTAASDGELLERCVHAPDEAAFTALVERHGALVYGVCSRILRNSHDAEDACQAAFLVLARRAASILKRASAASWLHGVARRASLTLLRKRIARQRYEHAAATAEARDANATDLLWSDALVLLDEELERLPEKLRAPIVLCHLEGKTRDEAAAALGLSPGRLHGLLQRGRAKLRDRLAKRGVALGAGFLAAEMSGGTGLALSPVLTVRIVREALAGTPTNPLAQEVLRAMWNDKLKSAFVWSAAGIALVGAGLVSSGFAREEPKPPVAPTVEVAPPPKAEPKPLQVRKTRSMPVGQTNDFRHAVIAVSNEQKSVLSRNLIVTDRDDPMAVSSGLHLWTLDGEKPRRTHLGDGTTIGFIPNSTLCFSVDWGPGAVLFDTRTHQKVGQPIPHDLREDTMPLPAVSPDGAVLATRPELKQVQFWDMKTRKPIAPAAVVRGIVYSLAFTSDGKWLFTYDETGDRFIWDPKTGKRAAGPFRNAGVEAENYSRTQGLATVEAAGEVTLRSGTDFTTVQRVKLPGRTLQMKWLGDTRLLVVSDRDGSILLQVVSLGGEMPEVQEIVRGTDAMSIAATAPDGKHFATFSSGTASCWKLGETKPKLAKTGAIPGAMRVLFGDGDWVLVAGKTDAVVYSLADGKELWRRDKVENVEVQGGQIWVFDRKAVEVWQVDR